MRRVYFEGSRRPLAERRLPKLLAFVWDRAKCMVSGHLPDRTTIATWSTLDVNLIVACSRCGKPIEVKTYAAVGPRPR